MTAGRLDVIFDGWSGGEPREIQIFINKGNSYKKIFSDMQAIYKIEWRDNRLSKLYIFDWGCCEEYSLYWVSLFITLYFIFPIYLSV